MSCIDRIANNFAVLQITECSHPLHTALIGALEGKSVPGLKQMFREAIPHLAGEELLAAIISMKALSYDPNQLNDQTVVFQALFQIAPCLFANKIQPKAYESLAGHVEWLDRALKLFCDHKSKEEIVSFCQHLLKNELPSQRSSFWVKVKNGYTLEGELHPFTLCYNPIKTPFQVAYLIAFHLARLLNEDAVSLEVLESNFYAMTERENVAPQALLESASLFSLVWALFEPRGLLQPRPQNGSQDPIERPKNPFLKEGPSLSSGLFLPQLHLFLKSGIGWQELEDLSQQLAVKSIVKGCAMRYCAPHQTLGILQVLTFGREGGNFSWLEHLDSFGVDLLRHFLQEESLPVAKRIELLPYLLAAKKIDSQQRLGFALLIVSSLKSESLTGDQVATLFRIFTKFVLRNISRWDLTGFSACHMTVDSLVATPWCFLRDHFISIKSILENLKTLEIKLFGREGYWKERVAHKAIAAEVCRAKILQKETRGKSVPFALIKAAIAEKHDIFESLQKIFLDLPKESQQKVRSDVAAMCKVIICGLKEEKHLLDIDGKFLVKTLPNLQNERPKKPLSRVIK